MIPVLRKTSLKRLGWFPGRDSSLLATCSDREGSPIKNHLSPAAPKSTQLSIDFTRLAKPAAEHTAPSVTEAAGAHCPRQPECSRSEAFPTAWAGGEAVKWQTWLRLGNFSRADYLQPAQPTPGGPEEYVLGVVKQDPQWGSSAA